MQETNSSASKPSNNSKENNNHNSNNRIINNNESTSKTKAVSAPPAVVAAVPGHQWVPTQYPAAAMVLPPDCMIATPHYAPQYMPYPHPHHHHHHHPQFYRWSGNRNGGGSNGDNRTIWVGNLHSEMDEDYLRDCFASTGEISSIKVIRNKQTGNHDGYGFVEFCTHAAAEEVLQSFSGINMPNADQPFRLNWATCSTGDKRSNDYASDLSIFVGDLAADVTDSLLHETFASKYPSVRAAKVVIDSNTGRSKGYGFVRFGDDNERSQAMTEMNGVYCSSRPMRIGIATPRPRKSFGYQPQYLSQGGYSNGVLSHGLQSNGDSLNTTIFVGRLDPNVTDEDLREPFSQYGEIVSVKIPVGKGCGFVQFVNRNDAEEALQQLSGKTIGKQTVRLSWGRGPAKKQSMGDFGHQWTGAYYGGPFFDGYGYHMPPPHNPNMYAAYGVYPFYGTHQQEVS